MTNIYLNNYIQRLELSPIIINKLNNHKMIKIKDLWTLKRKNLKEFGLSDKEIKDIIIKLQLNSINLNKKIYNRNKNRD